MTLDLGRRLTDRRGGRAIHTWDLGLKGEVTDRQRALLDVLIRIRRTRRWRTAKHTDDRPVTVEQIRTAYRKEGLEEDLADLVAKGYLALKHPKKRVEGRLVEDTDAPLGYDMTSGQMSYEITRVLTPDNVCPTIVPTDVEHIGVIVEVTE